MTIPFYSDFNHPGDYPENGHAGLWYDRFFNEYDTSGKVKEGGKLAWINKLAYENERGILTSRAVGGDKTEKFAVRQMELVDALCGKSIVVKTDWHFVTGMGINHPVENGFAWHPTLGVPYLTGAAVKGLLRAWCEQWSSEFKSDDGKAKLREWFGPSANELSEKENDIDPAAGGLIFFDAVPTQPVKLQADVMTPHYGKWYEKGGEDPAADGSNVPADWHNPEPIPFLAVAPGQSFLFAVAARPGCEINLDKVLHELKEALQWLGAGAKTGAGYGRMTKDEAAKKKIETELAHQKAALRIIEDELQKKKEIESLPPFERSIAELLAKKPDPNMKNYVFLIKKLDEGFWTDAEEKKKVAQKIRKLMQDDGVWKEKSSAKKPEKDGDYQRTMKVLNYLNQQ